MVSGVLPNARHLFFISKTKMMADIPGEMEEKPNAGLLRIDFSEPEFEGDMNTDTELRLSVFAIMMGKWSGFPSKAQLTEIIDRVDEAVFYIKGDDEAIS